MLKFIENQPGICILFGALLGFVVPGMDKLPPASILLIIGTVIYLACFNIRGLDFKSVSFTSILYFYIFRYIVLPFLIFHLLNNFSMQLAVSVTLLSLLPSGVSSPALSNIYGGNVALGLILCLLTHLLTPFLIPFMCRETIGTLVTIDIKAMFITLLITIVSPVILFFFTHKVSRIHDICVKFNKPVSIVLISSIGFFVIGMQKEVFISKLDEVPLLLLYSSLSFLFLFTYAWLTEIKEPIRNRVTYTIVSGFNNTALGVGVALLYFPSETSMFLIVSELPWCTAPLFFAPFIKRKTRQT